MSTPDPDKYLILVEQGPTSWGAWSPDLPGCVAAGETMDETIALMREAVHAHVNLMMESGDLIPEPTGPGIYVELHAAAA